MKFVWPTYTWDGVCCLESVKSVLRLGVPPSDCTVGVQVGRPLPDDIAAAIRTLGVSFTESRYPRRDYYHDIVAKLRLLLGTGGEWVVNVDSDIIVNSLDEVRRAEDEGAAAIGTSWPRCYFSGAFSAYRAEALRACLAEVCDTNALNLPFGGRMADDACIGVWLDHFEWEVRRVPQKKWLGWYKFNPEKDNLEEYAAAESVHFGQKRAAQKLIGKLTTREVIAEHMRGFMEWKETRETT